jgi:ArsR family transcriptional regulator
LSKFNKSSERIAALCKALAHPARASILEILIGDKECISGDLADRLPLAASTISEHLRILKESGLVKGTIDGPRRCYCVNPEVLNEFKELVKNL